jgi:hypothetical protein
MNETEQHSRDEWKTPLPEQEVSNRSILRVQQLSNEMAHQLKLLPIFKNGGWQVAQVLFAARDYSTRTSSTEQNVDKRWYNFRLCDAYRFPKEVRAWFKRDGQNIRLFKCLFDAANKVEHTRAAFEKFQRAVLSGDLADESDKLWNDAYEQLIIALAVIPYDGVLLGLLEKAFFSHKVRIKPPHAILFQPCDKGNEMKAFALNSFQLASEESIESSEAKEINSTRFHPHIETYEKDLTELFGNFLLEFTRGVLPSVVKSEPRERAQEDDAAHATDKSDNIQGIQGFAVPAYDALTLDGYRGGMAGWIVVIMSRSNEQAQNEDGSPKAASVREFFKQPKQAELSWEMFSLLAQTYVRRVREAQMLDIVEEYVALNRPPAAKRFFLQHIKRVCDICVFADVNESLERITKRDPLRLSDIELVKLRKLLDSNEFEPRLDLKRPLLDVCVSLERLAKTFFELLKDAENQHRAGEQAGFLTSAHDYSKDIGSVLLRLSDFKSDLDRSFQAIKEQAGQLSGLPAPASEVGAGILSELRSWTVPRFDWFPVVRFTNAHLATQTRGILVPEPIECVASLERGSLRDIYDVVRLLVWHPITLQKFKEREEEFAKFATDKLRLPSTWWTLFSFDLDPSPASQPFHERLGQRVLTLILDEKITQPDFARRFKIPRINPGIELDDPRSILWPDGEPDRWRPLDGLLPLFVFSMRFAFQCAWATTILDGPKEPLSIVIAASRPEDRRYELRITFPSLLPVGARLDDHPYYGEWKAQVAHYTGTPIWKTSPWKARAETHAVTQEDRDARCEVTLAATI